MCDRFIELNKTKKCEYCFYDSINKRCFCVNTSKKEVICNREDQLVVCEELWKDTRVEGD